MTDTALAHDIDDDLTLGAVPVDAIAAELAPTGPVPASVSPLGQVLRFGTIGVACTAAYLVLFVMLQGLLGAQVANLVALLITAVANTSANRRFTFGVRGRLGAARHQVQGLVVFAITLGITSGALDALHGLVADPSRTVEVGMLVLANLAATLIRFVLLRTWVFARRTH
ncbi:MULTISPECIES: GtrA family protein [unclassified Mycobacterium]|uniref:GtrA family protein n=1 Tax=unclassified Mycobacterium TaxID=2642494 RepID=UPI0029C7F880|nr:MULTISPECIES: GtrA family protein [unclassified Mycobacterium]